MPNQQLVDYIKLSLERGVDKEQIKKLLLSSGWQEAEVNEAFDFVESLKQQHPLPPLNDNQVYTQNLQSQTVFQESGKKKNVLFLVVSIFLGILLIGGGVFAYFYYFKETPEKVFEKMMSKIGEIEKFVKTVESQGEIRVQVEVKAQNDIDKDVNDSFWSRSMNTDMSLVFEGKTDFVDSKASFVVNKLKFSMDPFKIEPNNFALEGRVIDKNLYLKFNNLNLGFIDLSFLSNKWIKIDIEEIAKEENVDFEKIKKSNEEFFKSKLFRPTEYLGEEKIDAIKTNHYKFKIDKDEFKRLLSEDGSIKLSENEISDIIRDLDKTSGEVWIGKKDYLPYRLKLLTLYERNSENENSSGTSTIDIYFKNYNKPVQIDIPSQSKTIEEVMQELFNSSGNELYNPKPSLPSPVR
jgi:hypothetical protein